MARISADELLARLEKGKPIPAILLLGEEPYLRDSCRTLLIERYVPEAARLWAVSRYSADRGEMQAGSRLPPGHPRRSCVSTRQGRNYQH